MAWVRLDDHIDEHPKIVTLDDHAFALFIRGLAYCNRNLTDGFIPAVVAKQKMGARNSSIAALESVGLWESVAGGWQVHDYSVYQPTKQQVEDDRSKKQAAGQAGGRASAKARAQAGASLVVEAESNPVPDPYPTRTRTQIKDAVAAADAASPGAGDGERRRLMDIGLKTNGRTA